jgi:hypothetical protein
MGWVVFRVSFDEGMNGWVLMGELVWRGDKVGG